LYVAAEANSFGRGGIAIMHRITGIARSTIMRGQEELALQAVRQATHETKQNEILNCDEETQQSRIRSQGGGRKKKNQHLQNWDMALEKLIEPVARGDPESSLRWTIKSTKSLSEELKKQGFDVSPNTVMRQLHEMGYSLQSNFKTLTKASHPDRNKQFEYINNKVSDFINNNNPVIV
jgi:transposase